MRTEPNVRLDPLPRLKELPPGPRGVLLVEASDEATARDYFYAVLKGNCKASVCQLFPDVFLATAEPSGRRYRFPVYLGT